MESSKHQSWKISVHARSKGLDFRIDASNILPQWGKGGEKISLFLRLFRFFSLKAESKNRNPPRKTKRKSKLFHLLAKTVTRPRELIRNKPATKKRLQVRSPKIGTPTTNPCPHPCQDMVVATMASLCLLSHSAVEKDGGGIIIHALALIFCLVLLLKKRKTHSDLFWATSVVSVAGFYMSFLSYTGLVAKATSRVWNVVISLGCSFAFGQVMLSRTSLIIETRRTILLIVLVLLPSFFCKLSSSMKGMKILIDGAPAWIPNQILTRQALSHMQVMVVDLAFVTGAVFAFLVFVRVLVSVFPVIPIGGTQMECS
ncbi:hypothetical protein COCNU_04G012640 [Cocos nucifera]|uniref:Uncharacterized protein n=1 Tax=Cocos nucifera TaxID=13894 RepID=A0A8K0N0Q5_COCNU|nr:hypothetical protein COCNU_04G012640 [Cocos nucifera]